MVWFVWIIYAILFVLTCVAVSWVFSIVFHKKKPVTLSEFSHTRFPVNAICAHCGGSMGQYRLGTLKSECIVCRSLDWVDLDSAVEGNPLATELMIREGWDLDKLVMRLGEIHGQLGIISS